jgi:hypothetical protein
MKGVTGIVRPFRRAIKGFRSQPTVVLCAFDDEAHTLRMEIAGESEHGCGSFHRCRRPSSCAPSSCSIALH